MAEGPRVVDAWGPFLVIEGRKLFRAEDIVRIEETSAGIVWFWTSAGAWAATPATPTECGGSDLRAFQVALMRALTWEPTSVIVGEVPPERCTAEYVDTDGTVRCDKERGHLGNHDGQLENGPLRRSWP